jgi:hypothetical protein
MSEAQSVLATLWKIQEAATKAHRNKHRCLQVRSRLTKSMPLFTECITEINDKDHSLLKQLEAFAVSTLEFIKEFETTHYTWSLFFNSNDKQHFDKIFEQIEDLVSSMAAVLHQESTSSFINNKEFKDAKHTDLRNDILLDKKLIADTCKAHSSHTSTSNTTTIITVEDLRLIRLNLKNLIDDCSSNIDTNVLSVELDHIRGGVEDIILKGLMDDITVDTAALTISGNID